jgi:hypothetical protein
MVFGLAAIGEPTSKPSRAEPQLTRRIFKIDDCFPSVGLRNVSKDGENSQRLIVQFFKQHNDLTPKSWT